MLKNVVTTVARPSWTAVYTHTDCCESNRPSYSEDVTLVIHAYFTQRRDATTRTKQKNFLEASALT